MKNKRTQKIIVAAKRFYPSGWYMLPINTASVMISWYFNKDVAWAIVHWIFSIPNLLYRLLNGSFRDNGFMKIMESYF